MSEIISNTSPLQYLHQLGVLDILPKLVTTIAVPPAVQDELIAGRKCGLNLPDLQSLEWITVRQPSSSVALPIVTDLGAGTENQGTEIYARRTEIIGQERRGDGIHH